MIQEIINKKKNGTDCTEQESAEIKYWLRTTTILPGSGDQQILEDIQLLFPQEYGEVNFEQEVDENFKRITSPKENPYSKEVLNITKGTWEWKQKRGNNFYEHTIYSGDSVIAELNGDTPKEIAANAEAICNAVNSTYGKGIDPFLVPELIQMVIDLKNCIKRLSQDNLSQADRDTEAQWEGEAHELLLRINPNYYKNANEKS